MTNGKKRLAFISTMEGCAWGGSEELWSQSAMRLLEHGISVTASVRQWPTEPAGIQQLRNAGCVIHKRRYPHLLKRLARRVLPDREFAWLDRFRPDMVVISEGGTYEGISSMEACRKRNIPYISIAHSAAHHLWPADSQADRIRSAISGAKTYYFVSEESRRLASTQLATELRNSNVVRNPFAVPYDKPIPWPEGNTFRLACVGRLEPWPKGQDLLFRVLQQQKWQDRPLTVTLYGNGNAQEALKSLKDLWGLQMVSFGGHLDPAEIWKKEQMLVLPSRYEGLPVVIVEAMLSARPCIVTNVGGIAEVVEDERTGFVAAAPTVAFLDDAMERAWARRSEWKALGAVAASRIRELVPPDPVGRFVEELTRHLNG